MKQGIVGKYQPPLIPADRLTVAGMLKAQGYNTACIGKWHLGWNWHDSQGRPTSKESEIDFSKRLTGGPTSLGFDHYFGDDVPNWPPYVWIENDTTVGIPDQVGTPEVLFGGGNSRGKMMACWSQEEVLPEITRRSVACIERLAKCDEPFFLFFPLTSPHTPIVPTKEFRGKSGINLYADFVMQTDWCVGQIADALERTGQADNTLLFFTADNGTSPECNFAELERHGTNLRNHFRGHKADIFDGGHRVPFGVRWPGRIEAGTSCDETICLTDFMATVADVVGFKLPPNAAEDSASLLPLLTGEEVDGPLHAGVVHHSSMGRFAIRQGKWKLIFAHGSAGWSAPRESQAIQQGLPPIQLYDLAADPKEQKNLQAELPRKVAELTILLRKLVEDGRSTPGPKQRNDTGNSWPQLPWVDDG
jgi:arylsulfatase A-like enzyme